MTIFFLFCALELKSSFTTGTFLKKDGSQELRVFYEIPPKELTYVKTNPSGPDFYAKYEITCTLNRKNKEIGDIWTEESPYDSLKKQITGTLRLPVKPGKYEIKLVIRDLNSQKVSEKKNTITVDSINNNSLAFSSRRFTDDKKLMFEVYNFCKSPFKILYKSGDTSSINDSIMINDTNFINEITLKLDSLSFGTHRISIILCTQTICNSISDTIYVKEPFWVKNWESKVKQLYYLATDKELDSLRNTPLPQREREWIAFWEKKKLYYNNDHVETEYLKRVEYANANFSRGRDGWETDRGRVYILLGEPDEIENHPFEVDAKPYDVWYYYSKKVKYSKFIFQDKDGFGDYVLVSPIFLDVKFLPEK